MPAEKLAHTAAVLQLAGWLYGLDSLEPPVQVTDEAVVKAAGVSRNFMFKKAKMDGCSRKEVRSSRLRRNPRQRAALEAPSVHGGAVGCSAPACAQLIG